MMSKPHRMPLLAAILLFPCSLAMGDTASSSAQIAIGKSTLPPPSRQSALIRGASSGRIGESLIRIGGVNDKGEILNEAEILPLAGGSPVNGVNDTNKASPSWKIMPLQNGEGRAWAATAQHGDELILVGGLAKEGPSDRVTQVGWSGDHLVTSQLPPLPRPLLGAGAAILGEKLYVVGGVTSSESSNKLPEPLRDFLVLDLANPADGWKELDPLPGSGRVLPMVTAQYDLIEVIGGRLPSEGGFRTTKEVWTHRFKPTEGTTTKGWHRIADLPLPLAGGIAIPSGQAHTILFAADASPETSAPLALSYGVESPTLLYHAVTDVWNHAGPSTSLRGGACTRDTQGNLLLFGGMGSREPLSVTMPRTTRSLSPLDYLMIGIYFVLIGYIGYRFRKQESSAEFALGNRQVPWWAAGISIFATAASAISFMAIPALSFASNLVWFFPLIILLPVYFFQSRITYPLLRRLEITSTFEYLEKRFNTPLRLIASFLQIVFQTFGRAAIVLVLPSYAIAATTGLDVRWSVVIMGVLTTIYTGMGGFEAVIWTEVFQGILKGVAPIAIIAICIAALPGGFGEFLHTSVTHQKLDFAVTGWDLALPLFWVLLISQFLQNTIYQAGEQTIIQRVFASKEDELRKVTAMTFSCGWIISLLVNVMGIAIFAYFHAHPGKFDPSSSIDQIVPLFVTQELPHGFVGIIIAAIFASAMATVASSMNSVATIFTVDFYERWHPKASDSKNLSVMRISSYVVGAVATLIALWLTTLNIKSLMITWTVIAALMMGGVVGVFALGMFSTRANGSGAVCGALLSIGLGIYLKFCTSIHWQAYMPILILSAMIGGYLFSFLFRSRQIDLTGLTVYTPRKKS